MNGQAAAARAGGQDAPAGEPEPAIRLGFSRGRSTRAGRRDDPLRRCPQGTFWGRADLQGAAGRSIDLLRRQDGSDAGASRPRRGSEGEAEARPCRALWRLRCPQAVAARCTVERLMRAIGSRARSARGSSVPRCPTRRQSGRQSCSSATSRRPFPTACGRRPDLRWYLVWLCLSLVRDRCLLPLHRRLAGDEVAAG